MFFRDWLASVQAKLARRQILNASRKRRRVNHRCDTAPMQTEKLEPRVLLTVASAQAALNLAQANLNTEISDFFTGLDGIRVDLESDFAATTSTLQGTLNGIRSSFSTSAQSAVTGHLTGLSGIAGTFDVAVGGFESTLDGNIGSALTAYQTGIDGAESTYQTTTGTVIQNYDLAIDSLADSFEVFERGEFQNLQNDIDNEESGFETTWDGINSAFNVAAAAQQTAFDTAEQGFWSAYETTIGNGPGGLQTIYDGNLQTNQFNLDTTVSAYPGTVYDPTPILNDPTLVASIQAANTTFMENVTQHREDYDDAVAQHESDYRDAVDQARGVYDQAVEVASNNWRQTHTLAKGAYEAVVNPALNGYNNAVFGPGGIYEQFENNEALAFTVLEGALQAAEVAYDAIVEPAEANFDAAVDAANDYYSGWTTGDLAATGLSVTRTATVAEAVDSSTGMVEWTLTYTTNYGGFPLSWTQVTEKEPRVSGTLISTTVTTVGTVVTTTKIYDMPNIDSRVSVYATPNSPPSAPMLPPILGGLDNPFQTALQDRYDLYLSDVKQTVDEFVSVVAGFDQTFETAAENEIDDYRNNVAGFASNFGAVVDFETQDFDTDRDFAMSNYDTSLSGMMGGYSTTTPFSGGAMNLDAAVKTYALDVLAANIDFVDNVGAGLVDFVIDERAEQTLRAKNIIDAAYDRDLDVAIAEHALTGELIELEEDFLKAFIGIQAGYDTAEAGRRNDRDVAVANAAQTFDLIESGAARTRTEDEADGYRNYEHAVADDWQDALNDESIERTVVLNAAAGAAEAFRGTMAGADRQWMDDEALAQKVFVQKVHDETAGLVGDSYTEELDYTNDVTIEYTSWTGSVAGDIASTYASFHGGNFAQTQVANAHRTRAIADAGAYSSYINGEANAHAVFGNSTASAWQMASDNVATAGESATNNVSLAYDNALGNIASDRRDYDNALNSQVVPNTNTATGAENTATKLVANAARAETYSVAGVGHALEISTTNDFTAYMADSLGAGLTYEEDTITQFATTNSGLVGLFANGEGSMNTGFHNARLADLADVRDAAKDLQDLDDPLAEAQAVVLRHTTTLSAEIERADVQSQNDADVAREVPVGTYSPRTKALEIMNGAHMVRMVDGDKTMVNNHGTVVDISDILALPDSIQQQIIFHRLAKQKIRDKIEAFKKRMPQRPARGGWNVADRQRYFAMRPYLESLEAKLDGEINSEAITHKELRKERWQAFYKNVLSKKRHRGYTIPPEYKIPESEDEAWRNYWVKELVLELIMTGLTAGLSNVRHVGKLKHLDNAAGHLDEIARGADSLAVGRFGGLEIAEGDWTRIRKMLLKRNTDIFNDGRNLVGKQVGRFKVYDDGSAAIFMRKSATESELLHELMHLRQFDELKATKGIDYAVNYFRRPETFLAREEYAFRAMRRSSAWVAMTAREQAAFTRDIEELRTRFGSP